MIFSTVNRDTSCVPSFVFTMIFGCPCSPLPIQPWSQSYAIILFVLGLPELYINLPLSKLFIDSAMNCGTCSSSLRSTVPDIAVHLRLHFQCELLNAKSSSLQVRRRKCDDISRDGNTQLLHDTSGPTQVNTKCQHGLSRRAIGCANEAVLPV